MLRLRKSLNVIYHLRDLYREQHQRMPYHAMASHGWLFRKSTLCHSSQIPT